MGSWGPRTFEDDLACDWLEDLLDSDPIAFFDHCLDLNGLDALGMLACIGVVCTAEMIHGLICEPRNGLPEAARRWLDRHRPLTGQVIPLVPTAVEGIERVLQPNSAMHLQWDDAGDLERWRREVKSLWLPLRAMSIRIGPLR